MVSIKKTVLSCSSNPHAGSPIGFVVYPHESPKEEIHVELSPFHVEESIIRMVDEKGELLLQDEQEDDLNQHRLIFTIKNLDAGTYFFEVNDGFYYQVKELRIPPV